MPTHRKTPSRTLSRHYELVKQTRLAGRQITSCRIGNAIWIGSASGLISIRHASSGQLLRKLFPVPQSAPAALHPVTAIALQAPLHRVWIAMGDGELGAWDVHGTTRLVHVPKSRHAVTRICIAPSAIWTIDSNGVTTQRDLQGGVTLRVAQDDFARDLALVGDDEVWAACDAGLIVFDVGTGEILHRLAVPRRPGGRTRLPVRCVLATTTAVFSGQQDGSMAVWDTAQKTVVQVLNVHSQPIVSLVSHGSHVWSLDSHNDVHCWNAVNRASYGFVDLNMVDGQPGRRAVISTVCSGANSAIFVLYSEPSAMEIYALPSDARLVRQPLSRAPTTTTTDSVPFDDAASSVQGRDESGRVSRHRRHVSDLSHLDERKLRRADSINSGLLERHSPRTDALEKEIERLRTEVSTLREASRDDVPGRAAPSEPPPRSDISEAQPADHQRCAEELSAQRQLAEQALLTLREERFRWVRKARLLTSQLRHRNDHDAQGLASKDTHIRLLQQQVADLQRSLAEATALLAAAQTAMKPASPTSLKSELSTRSLRSDLDARELLVDAFDTTL